MKTVHVAAAVMIRGDRVYATQRGYGEFKDKWEFPGGKVEAGETPEKALVRETVSYTHLDVYKRQAHILGKLFHFSKVHDWSVTAGNKPDTGLFGLCAGVDFVTEHGEVVDMGANERDAFFGAAPSKVCVFRKKAIAGMDGVDMVLMGHPDDLFYIKVGIDWLFPFPDQIRLIGAEAMEG